MFCSPDFFNTCDHREKDNVMYDGRIIEKNRKKSNQKGKTPEETICVKIRAHISSGEAYPRDFDILLQME